MTTLICTLLINIFGYIGTLTYIFPFRRVVKCIAFQPFLRYLMFSMKLLYAFIRFAVIATCVRSFVNGEIGFLIEFVLAVKNVLSINATAVLY